MTDLGFSGAAAIAFVAAYAVGSLPFGLIVARVAGGIDIRKEGSGDIGATNVARVLGAKYGIMVLVLDCLKGAAATGLLPLFLLPPNSANHLHLAVLSGVAAILGHMFPCWIGFRGGKGWRPRSAWRWCSPPLPPPSRWPSFPSVLRWCGLSPSPRSSGLGVSALELWLLRPNPFAQATWSLAAFSTVVPILIVVRHRANLARLLQGTEPKFRFGGPKRDP